MMKSRDIKRVMAKITQLFVDEGLTFDEGLAVVTALFLQLVAHKAMARRRTLPQAEMDLQRLLHESLPNAWEHMEELMVGMISDGTLIVDQDTKQVRWFRGNHFTPPTKESF